MIVSPAVERVVALVACLSLWLVGCQSAGDAPAVSGVSRVPITSDSVLEHVRSLPLWRSPSGEGYAETPAFLAGRLEAWGYEVQFHSFEWHDFVGGAHLTNVEVRIPGNRADAPLILVGAHWDTVPPSPGADDNGSGVAALLEVARRLSGRSLGAEVRLIWFDGEESGLAGSREYANSMSSEERARCVGMIDLESVGYTNRMDGAQRMPPGSDLLLDVGDVGDFLLILGNLESQSLADTVSLALASARSTVLRVEVFSSLPGQGWIMPDSRRSDHASFWDIGVPAVMLTDTANFRNPNYHRASDTVETLDGAFLAAVARGVERAIVLLASADEDD